MWVMAMFDLPVETKKNRRDYRRFHDALEAMGFMRMQFSVYARPCSSPEQAASINERIKAKLPPEGEVRLLNLTALQYSRMTIYQGEVDGKPEEPPQQLSFF
jgi:CRISPR-associated protein Cas2